MTQAPVSDSSSSALPVRASDLLSVGLGTATAMWVAGYVLHIPLIQPHVPNWLVFVVLVLVMLAGGYVFGRDSVRGWRSAWIAPLITALVNMLIFSSVLKHESRDTLMVSLPGFFAATELVMLIGFAIGKIKRRDPSRANWRLRLALVPVAATALVVSAGGLVTGFDAGFSVPDWPTTFKANMFLYPVAHMTGGVFYEHGHRLAGTLVGVIAIVTAIYMWATSRKWWLVSLVPLAGLGVATGVLLKMDYPHAVQVMWFIALGLTLLLPLVWGAIRRSMICWGYLLVIVMVITQGIAGGLWVESAWLPYVLFHGSFGQMILATFVVLAATQTLNWRNLEPVHTPAATTDHWLTIVLLAAFVLQTVLGVYVRQRPEGPLMEHMTFAGFVAALVVAVALRGLILYRKRLPPIKRISHGLLHGTVLQILLGICALIVRQHNQGIDAVDKVRTPLGTPSDALITTMHQSVGAFLLAFAALAVAWNWRLLRKSK